MNEPIQCAQKQTGKVTAKALLEIVRQGDRHFFHGRATHNRESYSDSFIFEFTSKQTATKDRVETSRTLDVPGWVSNGNTSAREERTYDGRRYWRYVDVYRPTSGFEQIDSELLRDVLEVLPIDAEVGFHVYLDAMTSELLVSADSKLHYMTEQGLHGDKVYLVAWYERRGKRVQRKFIVSAHVCAHNSARFGGGK